MTRLTRWAARWATILTLTATTLIIGAPAATAAFGCDPDVPEPEVPGRGLTGLFINPPDKPPPATANPFAANPDTSVYEVYGYAGMTWQTYQGECPPSPTTAIATLIANLEMEIPKFLTAITAALLDVAYNPTFLDVFDPLILTGVTALREGLFDRWVVLFITLAGVAILLKTRRGTLTGAATAAGWAVMVMAIAAAVFAWPLTAGHAVDRAVPATIGAAAAGITGTTSTGERATAGALVDTVVYRQWLRGTFGTTDSEAVTDNAPAIFDGQALTWREAAQVEQWLADGNTDAVDDLYDAKADQWKAAAEAIEDADPDAYAYLTGDQSAARVGLGLMAIFAAFASVPFIAVAALLVLCCYLVFRLAVIMAPALLTVGVLNSMSGLVTGTATVLAAAAINSVIFGVGSLITLLGINVLYNPDAGIPDWLAVVLVGLFSLVMWVVCKPFRSLTRMMPRQHNVFGEVSGSLTRTGHNLAAKTKRLGGMAAAAYVGNAAALTTTNRGADDDGDGDGTAAGGRSPAPYRQRHEGTTREHTPSAPLPALPAPTGTAAPTGLPPTPANAALPAAPPATPAPSPNGAAPALPATAAAADTPHTLPTGPTTGDTIPANPDTPDTPTHLPTTTADTPTPTADTAADLYHPDTPTPPDTPPAADPEIIDGEQVYVLYRPPTGDDPPEAPGHTWQRDNARTPPSRDAPGRSP